LPALKERCEQGCVKHFKNYFVHALLYKFRLIRENANFAEGGTMPVPGAAFFDALYNGER